MTEVSLRRMESSDLQAVAALEALGGDVHWSFQQLADELAKPISRYYVAHAPQARIVGYVGGYVLAPELQIANIVIHPEFRCRGIGRRLLEVLIKEAISEGCQKSTLEVRANNTHAQALYRAAGFVPTGRRPQPYQNPVDDGWLMEKSL